MLPFPVDLAPRPAIRYRRVQVLRGLLPLLAALLVVGLIGWGYNLSGTMVTLTVDGQAERVRTHRATVGALLDDMGLRLGPLDWLSPAPTASLTPGMEITVRRARHVIIEADGRRQEVPTWDETIRDALATARIGMNPYDRLWLDGVPAKLDTALPPVTFRSPAAPHFPLGRSWVGREPAPVTIKVRRAVPLIVQDEGPPFTLYTTASTIGEALREENIVLYLGDMVEPSLGSRVRAGLHVLIQRSKPVVLVADGRTLRTRTRQTTVGDVLAEKGIAVAGLDRVTPSLSEPLSNDITIRVTRVREAIEIEQDVVPYDTILAPDDNLEIDHQQVLQPGAEGITNWRYRVVYEDGKRVSKTLEDTWVAQEPVTRVISYGRKVVVRELTTPEGTVIRYWRKVRMLATSYSASTAGVSPTDPHYGYTRLGLPMRGGIVAVDPRVINLGSSVYVPGYGSGFVGDTGGAILGRRIDLGYDDDKLIQWYRWVDVYLLAPPPPSYQIRYLLPNWPRER